MRAALRATAVGAVAVIGLTMAGAPAGAGPKTHLRGTFAETAAGAGLGYDIKGTAKLTVSAKGTEAMVHVRGLQPRGTYTSHLHNAPCSVNVGGGHYKHDPTGADTPPNELWLTSNKSSAGLRANPGGVVTGRGSAAWAARITSSTTNARSIVIHGSGAKIACADLT